MSEIDKLLNDLSDDKKAILLKMLNNSSGELESIKPRNGYSGKIPLSSAQERLWFLSQLQPENSSDNVPVAFKITGNLDVNILEKSFNEIIKRHEVLRTSYVSINNEAGQVINRPFEINIEVIKSNADSIQSQLTKEAQKGFDLSKSPLFRVVIFRLNENENILFINMHHSISDGWSLAVLYKELEHFYKKISADSFEEIEPLTIQYADYSLWQRKLLESDLVKNQIEYWKENLKGKLSILDLPTDKARPAVQTFNGAKFPIEIEKDIYDGIASLSKTESVTIFMIVLAAFQILLKRYSGQDEILVGSPIANRSKQETENLIGLFLNMLVLPGDLSSNIPFNQYLKIIREQTLTAYSNQDVPFDKLVEVLHPSRDLSRSPLFQVMLQVSKKASLNLADLKVEQFRFDSGTAQLDISLHLWESKHGFDGHFEYNTDLFEEKTIERFTNHFKNILKEIIKDPLQNIDEINLLPKDEFDTVIKRWNDTDVEYNKNILIHQLIENQAEKNPQKTAVVFKDKSLTYFELNSRANQLAQKLAKIGVDDNVIVGIYMERSLEMMVALLAVMKSGGAYVPLDPTYPAARLAYMIKDASMPVIITQPKLSNQLPENDAAVIKIDDSWNSIDKEKDDKINKQFNSENLAYIIYTSGSTGNPKGVMVKHRNVVNFFAGMDEKIKYNSDASWLAVTSISFDISVLELFWTLSNGFKVVIQANDEINIEAEQKDFKAIDKKMDFSLFYFSSDESENTSNKYKLLIEGAKFADENGFHAVWTPERHFHAFGGLYPNPAVAGAAIAAITKNVRIMAGSCVSPLHSTIRVAEEWSVVDNISGGRVGISFAAGWQPNDFVLMPQNFNDRKNIMFDQITEIKKLWGGESLEVENPFGKKISIKTLPRPIQKELPVWITAAANPETFKMAGEKGYNILTHLLGQSLDDVAEKISIYRKARKENGYDEKTGRITLMLHTYIGSNEEEVINTVREPMKNYLKSSVDLLKKAAWTSPIFKENTTNSEGNFSLDNLNEDELDTVLEHSFTRYYKTSGLFGTPEGCAEFVEKLKAIDVDEIACLLDFGVETEKALSHISYLNELRKISNKKDNSEDYSINANIKNHKITHLQCTPSMAKMILMDDETKNELKNIQNILIGGEAFPSNLARDLRNVFGGKILNMYGPTETTIWSAVYDVEGTEESIPIGKPIANTSIYILDKYDMPQPMGVAGELAIGGDGVVKGYLNRDDLTAEKFVQNPFIKDDYIYKTGDLAKFGKDGIVEFLGRIDHQVKIRGFRIELGEIETLISKNSNVKETSVIAREDIPGDKRLVAYLTKHDGVKIDINNLKSDLKEKLPEYMVPSHFIVMDVFPLTPNGKIDRKSFPSPSEIESADEGEFILPTNEAEEKLVIIWQKILNVPKVGTKDNFFDIGGHSLLAVQVHRDVKETFKKNLMLTDIFRFPTIKTLAEYLSRDSSGVGIHETEQRIEHRVKAIQNQRQLRFKNRNLRSNENNEGEN